MENNTRQPMTVREDFIVQAIRDILLAIGEDPNRSGLVDTPKRVAKAYAEMFSGLHQDPKTPLQTQFDEDVYNDHIIVKDIPFYSVCEHHLLPFYGRVHIAYQPNNGKVTGLSKFARCVDIVSKRPQVQERMTQQIHEAITEALNPFGVVVVVEAEHMCMSMRGVKKQGSLTVTQHSSGFTDDDIRDILSQFRG